MTPEQEVPESPAPTEVIVAPDTVPQVTNNLAIQVFNASTGFLPPASEAARYEALSPGFLGRMLSMAEKEAEHRRQMETLETEAGIWLAKAALVVGMSFTLAVALAGIGAAVHVAVSVHPLAGVAIFGVDVFALARLFTQFKTRIDPRVSGLPDDSSRLATTAPRDPSQT